MWDLLKSKVSNFISKITGEAKQEEAPLEKEVPKEELVREIPKEEPKPVVEEKSKQVEEEKPKQIIEEKAPEKEKPIIAEVQKKPEPVKEEPKSVTKVEAPKPKPVEAPRPQPVQIEKKPEPKPVQIEKKPVEQPKPEIKKETPRPEPVKVEVPVQKPPEPQVAPAPIQKPPEKQGFHIPFLSQPKKPEPVAPAPVEPKVPAPVSQPTPAPKQKPPEEEAVKIKVGITDHLKKMVLRKIKLSRDKVEEIVLELEFALIQSDVHPDIAKDVCEKITERLSDKEFTSDELEREIKKVLKEVFREEAFGTNKPFNIIERSQSLKKPVKILFVGPNGAGKTTTIAKVAHKLMQNGMTVVISASDTFRAAAIEQSEEHGRRLGVRVIRQNYGADSAAVAYDAIKHAEANSIDVVLIDSAGRQDTNFNLIKELEKINRVTSPDIKVFIGESLAGNSLYQQVKTFNDSIKLDGIILTKADCDAKGGTAISILRETGVPIIYLGVGQKYDDLIEFDPDRIIDGIF